MYIVIFLGNYITLPEVKLYFHSSRVFSYSFPYFYLLSGIYVPITLQHATIKTRKKFRVLYGVFSDYEL